MPKPYVKPPPTYQAEPTTWQLKNEIYELQPVVGYEFEENTMISLREQLAALLLLNALDQNQRTAVNALLEDSFSKGQQSVLAASK